MSRNLTSLALRVMNERRTSTSSPISTLNSSSAWAASSSVTWSRTRCAGVHRGGPQFLGVHLAQTLEALYAVPRPRVLAALLRSETLADAEVGAPGFDLGLWGGGGVSFFGWRPRSMSVFPSKSASTCGDTACARGRRQECRRSSGTERGSRSVRVFPSKSASTCGDTACARGRRQECRRSKWN